jgi:hypothetical protein
MKEQLQLETWILKETAYEIFLPMKNILLNELQNDTFPRYIRTKSCSKVMAAFVDNPKVIIPLSSAKYRLSDKDFEKPFISKNEMDFMKEIKRILHLGTDSVKKGIDTLHFECSISSGL